MYSELSDFARRSLSGRPYLTDGEFWTPVGAFPVLFAWFHLWPDSVPRVRSHFGDALNATSIIFGFALAGLTMFFQTAENWSAEERVARVAQKIVDWYTWTILCLLALICYILGLWAFGAALPRGAILESVLYAALASLMLYCGCQILNHTLNVWWAFVRRLELKGEEEGSEAQPGSHAPDQEVP